MISSDISLERALSDETRRLSFRIQLAEDLGAAVLGIDDPYETDKSLIAFSLRLHREQPDLAKQLDELYGRFVVVAGERSASVIGQD